MHGNGLMWVGKVGTGIGRVISGATLCGGGLNGGAQIGGKGRRALWGDGMGTNPDTPLDGTCSYSCLLQESREPRAES